MTTPAIETIAWRPLTANKGVFAVDYYIPVPRPGANYAEAFKRMGPMRVLSDTAIASNSKERKAIVAANMPTRDSAKSADLIKIQANLFMDATDNSTWQMVSDATGSQRLVKTINDELEAAFNEYKTRRVLSNRQYGVNELNQINAMAHDFVCFYDVTAMSEKFGFVVSNDHETQTSSIIASGRGTPIAVSYDTVLSAMGMDDYKEHWTKVQAAQGDAAKLIAYYSQIFSSDPKFMSDLTRVIKDAMR